jgi:hypothetical protein
MTYTTNYRTKPLASQCETLVVGTITDISTPVDVWFYDIAAERRFRMTANSDESGLVQIEALEGETIGFAGGRTYVASISERNKPQNIKAFTIVDGIETELVTKVNVPFETLRNEDMTIVTVLTQTLELDEN